MVHGPVLGQHVQSEVRLGVAPDRVRMVRTALGVVPLDEQSWPLEPVVVRLPGFDRAGPGEMDLVERGIVVRREWRDAVRDPAEVGAEE